MKKAFMYYGIVWLVLVLMFNVIIFVTLNEIAGKDIFDGSFWVGYIFIMLVLVGQLAVAYYSFKGSIRQTFYRLPLVSISYITLAVTLCVGIVCMIIPNFPVWVGVILCLLVLAFSIITLTSAHAAASSVDNLDNKIKAQTFWVKSLIVDIDTLLEKSPSDEVRGEVKKLYENVRYSDPMSNEALTGLETQITLKVSALSEKIDDNDFDTVKNLCSEIAILVKERNKKCMLLK